MTLLAVALGAYLLGSIPFAVVISRLFGLADPRSFGSGNPGATNVLRTGNKLAALLTLVGDAAKGLIAILIVRAVAEPLGLHPHTEVVAGLAAFIGHVFPLFLGFKGGKGVSTALGVLLGATPLLGLAALGVWLTTAFTTRYSSLSALVAAISAPALTWWLLDHHPAWTGGVAVMSAILVWRHVGNIQRLLRGEESRIGSKKSAA